MEAPRLVVPAICALALGAASLATSFVAASTTRDGRDDLLTAARELTDALASSSPGDERAPTRRVRPSFDDPSFRARVESRLAPGFSIDDDRVREFLEATSRQIAAGYVVARVRVLDGGMRAESGILVKRGPAYRAPRDEPDLKLHWVRSPGGRWGLVPFGR